MRIIKLDEQSKKNILSDLLKRSPNNYDSFQDSVNEILANVKENNNLRDFYYRDIMLGEQNEQLYESTNNSEIAIAFREAGEKSGS